jgi:hypothetical protein
MDQAVVAVMVLSRLLLQLLQLLVLLLTLQALNLQVEPMVLQMVSAKVANAVLLMDKRQAIRMAIAKDIRIVNAMLAPKLTIKDFNAALAKAQFLAHKKVAPTAIAMALIAA